MAISANFNADFSKWDAALAKATVNMKAFEVPVKGLEKSLQRLTDSLDGRKITQQADIAVKAVKGIGGATKLTEAEQRKLNVTVTEAIAKYHALGQQAPADLVKLQRELKQTDTATKGIASSLGGMRGLIAGAFTVGAITAAARSVLEFAGNLTDLSSRTGISVRALQEFNFAGTKVGVSLETIVGAVGQLQKRLGGGGEGVQAALKDLGLSFSDIRSLSPEQQFTVIADKLKEVTDQSKFAALGAALMGKGFLEAAPLIRAGLSESAAEAHRLGVVLSEETVANLDNLGDSLDVVRLAGQAMLANFLVPATPLIKALAEGLTGLAGSFGSFSGPLVTAQRSFMGLIAVVTEFTAYLYLAAEAQLRFSQAINPVALATNAYGAAIKEAGEKGNYFLDKSKAIRLDLYNLIANDYLGRLGTAARQFGEQFKGAAPFVEDTSKAVNKLKDQLTGGDLVKNFLELVKAFRSLTPEERQSAIATDTMAKAAATLAPLVGQLSPGVEALRREFQASIPQTERFAGLMTLLSTSIPNAAGVLADAATRVRNLTQDVIPSTRALSDLMVGAMAVPGPLRDIGDRAEETARRTKEAMAGLPGTILRSFADLTKGISDAFAEMLVGARSFKEGFLDIWRSIQQSIARILSDILDDFVGRFLQGMLNALLGKQGGFSAAFAGMFGGGGGGGGGLFGNLLGLGVGAAGIFGAAAPVGLAATIPVGGGIGIAGLTGGGGAAGAAGGAGLFGLGALGTAGIVGGAALAGYALYNWYRRKQESMQVNDLRDQYLAQFGPGGTGPTSGFGSLAAQLTTATGQAGGGTLFQDLISASKIEDFQAALAAVNTELERYAEQQAQGTAATEAATAAQEQQIATLTSKMQTLDDELARLNASEAPEEHMGVIEQLTRERIAGEQAALQAELDRLEASKAATTQWRDEMIDAINSIQDELDRLHAPDLTARVTYATEAPEPGTYTGYKPPGYAWGTGLGFVDFGRESLVRLHGREAVVREDQASAAASRWGGGGGTMGGSLQAVTIMQIDKREIGRAVADVLPGELRRLGVRVRA